VKVKLAHDIEAT